MKSDRLIGILSILLQGEKTTAPELAEKFEVSRRTINVSASDNHGCRCVNSSHIMVVRSKYCACRERGYHESNSNCWRTTSADQGLAA